MPSGQVWPIEQSSAHTVFMPMLTGMHSTGASPVAGGGSQAMASAQSRMAHQP